MTDVQEHIEGAPAGMVIAQVLAWKCARCAHVWQPRNFGKPRVCPKCKSPYWNRSRREPAPIALPEEES